MKIFAKSNQSDNVLGAAGRKELLVAPLIQTYFLFKSYFKKRPLRIGGALIFNRIKSPSKGIVFEKKKYIKKIKKIHTRLDLLGLKRQANYLLINNIGGTNQADKILIEIQIYRKLKKFKNWI